MKRANVIASLILISLSLGISQTVGIAGEFEYPDTTIVGQSRTVAVLPFVNNTAGDKMKTMIEPLIYSRLHEFGWDFITSEELRKTLRKYRIRSGGGLSASDTFKIKEELQVNFLLNGSYDVFIDQEIPEAAFSMRLIDVGEMKIVRAVSVASSGEDFTGLFGIGRVKSTDILLAKLVEKAFEGFEQSPADDRKRCDTDLTKISFAVVPFDNISANRKAGDIVNSIFLSELISVCADVKEPGVIVSVFRAENRLPRGEIDYTLLAQMRDELNIDYVITGTVENFNPGRADVDGSSPEIQLGGRLIDAKTGRIISIYGRSRRGSDSETFFKLGSCYSLGKLSQEVIKSLVRDFISDVRDNLVDIN
jgi:TolB-like protein